MSTKTQEALAKQKPAPTLQMVKLKDITISKSNPRKHFDEESINELAQSIKEKGVLQPIVLRKFGKGYDLVCGERRYRASKIAGLEEIPATIHELTDNEALELMIVENLQRKDIHPMEEAVAFKGLIAIKNFDVQEIAKRIGKGPAYVAQRLKLNELVQEFQKPFYQDRMTISTALTLAKLRPEDQKALYEDESDNEGQIEISDWQLRRFMCDLNDPPFDKADPALNKKMGGCGGCQFNSASNSLLFPDQAHSAVCMNSECYGIKCTTFFQKELKEAKNNPSVVLISTDYNMGKDGRDLINKGEKVYGYRDFSKEERPEAPDIMEYDLSDFDNEKERQKKFHDDVKRYQKDLEEHEKKVASGKYIKAFVVDGNDKGKYVFIEFAKNKSEIKTTQAGLKAKALEGKVTVDDIKAELERVKESEKRKKEIDQEKIHYSIFEVFYKNKDFKVKKEPLGIEELRAAIIALAEFSFEASKRCQNFFQVATSHDNSNLNIYNKLLKLKHAELQEGFNVMLRSMFLSKLSPVKGAPNQRPDNNGHAAALEAVAKLYEPKAAAEIERAQMEEREKRVERVNARIKSLQDKAKELGKPGAEPVKNKKPKKA